MLLLCLDDVPLWLESVCAKNMFFSTNGTPAKLFVYRCDSNQVVLLQLFWLTAASEDLEQPWKLFLRRSPPQPLTSPALLSSSNCTRMRAQVSFPPSCRMASPLWRSSSLRCRSKEACGETNPCDILTDTPPSFERTPNIICWLQQMTYFGITFL